MACQHVPSPRPPFPAVLSGGFWDTGGAYSLRWDGTQVLDLTPGSSPRPVLLGGFPSNQTACTHTKHQCKFIWPERRQRESAQSSQTRAMSCMHAAAELQHSTLPTLGGKAPWSGHEQVHAHNRKGCTQVSLRKTRPDARRGHTRSQTQGTHATPNTRQTPAPPYGCKVHTVSD